MEQTKYEFGSFDKYGNLNGKYIVGMFFLIFITSFLILLTLKNIIELHSIDYKLILNSLFSEFKRIFYIFKSNDFIGVISEYKTIFIIGISLIIYYFYNVISKKLEQRKLANYGLENYYLKKKLKDGYIYEVVPGSYGLWQIFKTI